MFVDQTILSLLRRLVRLTHVHHTGGSLEGNGVTHKTLYLLRDPKMTPLDHILLHVRRRKIALYVGIQWLFFAMTFAISQTIGA